MKKIVLVVLFLFLPVFFVPLGRVNTGVSTDKYVRNDNLKCNYFNKFDFLTSIKGTPNVKTETKKIRGGVVPHHLLAAGLISEFFKILSKEDAELIIVIGPNHPGVGEFDVVTSDKDWDTYFGTLGNDKTVTEKIIKSGFVYSNSVLMEKEHSVSSLIPYIKYYMPEVKVVPLLIKGHLSLEYCEQFGKTLGKIIKSKKALIIASIDFSHYLAYKNAEANDIETFAAITKGDLKKISLMGNDNIDSPPSMITLLSALGVPSSTNIELLRNSNSFRITGRGSEYTTSYFTMIFH